MTWNASRIGFCCKYKHPDRSLDKKALEAVESAFNQKSTTITHLKKLSKSDAYDKIFGILEHNVQSLRRQFEWVAQQPINMRMMRIGSDFVPGGTHKEFAWVLEDKDIVAMLEKNLAALGTFARKNFIRLSMHPGQFTLLNATSEDVVERSIIDLEYHAMIMRMLGYGSSWHDFGSVINIHGGGKANGLTNVKYIIDNKLSVEARNLITLENDEFSFGIDDLLSISDSVAVVLDIHHHLIFTHGEYIKVNDPRIQRIQDSWRGQRPLGHFSTSREDVLINESTTKLPDVKQLLSDKTFNRSDLRAHSDGCWNTAANDWALEHLLWTDLEVEAKDKNLASMTLYKRALETGILKD